MADSSWKASACAARTLRWTGYAAVLVIIIWCCAVAAFVHANGRKDLGFAAAVYTVVAAMALGGVAVVGLAAAGAQWLGCPGKSAA